LVKVVGSNCCHGFFGLFELLVGLGGELFALESGSGGVYVTGLNNLLGNDYFLDKFLLGGFLKAGKLLSNKSKWNLIVFGFYS
jgi:hypothetical protein